MSDKDLQRLTECVSYIGQSRSRRALPNRHQVVPAIGYAVPVGYPETRSANVKKKCSHSKSKRGTQTRSEEAGAEPLMPVKGDHERCPSTR